MRFITVAAFVILGPIAMAQESATTRTGWTRNKIEITEYVLDFKEVRIVGDQAFEWARTSITVRPKGTGTDFHVSGNLMRLLRKQPDGSWKVARAIWNDNSSPQKAAPPRQQER